jgi:hypothetical protein
MHAGDFLADLRIAKPKIGSSSIRRDRIFSDRGSATLRLAQEILSVRPNGDGEPLVQ